MNDLLTKALRLATEAKARAEQAQSIAVFYGQAHAMADVCRSDVPALCEVVHQLLTALRRLRERHDTMQARACELEREFGKDGKKDA